MSDTTDACEQPISLSGPEGYPHWPDNRILHPRTAVEPHAMNPQEPVEDPQRIPDIPRGDRRSISDIYPDRFRGCGRKVRYITVNGSDDGDSCNKYGRCMSWDELKAKYDALREAANMVLGPLPNPLTDEDKIGAAPLEGLEKLRDAMKP